MWLQLLSHRKTVRLHWQQEMRSIVLLQLLMQLQLQLQRKSIRVTISERIVDTLVSLEMVDFLPDCVAVALADVGTKNISGGIRIDIALVSSEKVQSWKRHVD